jgi:alpha-L-fucosidase
VLYAVCLGWPQGKATIRSLGSNTVAVSGVSMLGVEGELAWTQDAGGLTVTVPAEKPCKHAYTFRVALTP